jgi:hypothetical protein
VARLDRAACFADAVSPEDLDRELSRRRTAGGENRLPPACAVAAALVVYALLPSSILFTGRLVIPVLEVVLLGVLVATNPRRLTRETRLSRLVSIGLAAVIIVTNMVSLGMLIAELTDSHASAGNLLLAAMQVWVTNVIGFGLLFWEIDRGGPVSRNERRRDELPAADWRFSQDENDDAVVEVSRTSSATSGWVPTFVDYLFLSVTNSSAFSPTDTMPLTSRAKMLMAVEATAALLTSLLVVARAVGTLGG